MSKTLSRRIGGRWDNPERDPPRPHRDRGRRRALGRAGRRARNPTRAAGKGSRCRGRHQAPCRGRQDLAWLATYLASPKSECVTGEVIAAGGGVAALRTHLEPSQPGSWAADRVDGYCHTAVPRAGRPARVRDAARHRRPRIAALFLTPARGSNSPWPADDDQSRLIFVVFDFIHSWRMPVCLSHGGLFLPTWCSPAARCQCSPWTV